MKRALCLILSAVCILSVFTACSKNKNEKGTSASAKTTTEEELVVDLDLSKLSGTVVYAEVYNIMTEPEKYVGEIIKIKGNFQIFQDNTLNKIYYSCVIPDATACCQQGIEFVPAKQMRYPQDFPELETEITVTGKFTPYTENGVTYYTLKNSTIEF